jgi:tetratricopeptide (TPR) repeat protein
VGTRPIHSLTLAFLITFGFAVPGYAQRGSYEAEEQIQRALRTAQRAYDNLELERSERSVAEAIRIIERLGTSSRQSERLAAQVYIQRGILAFVKSQNRADALRDFRKALDYDSRAKLDEMVETPSLRRLFEDARRREGDGSNERRERRVAPERGRDRTGDSGSRDGYSRNDSRNDKRQGDNRRRDDRYGDQRGKNSDERTSRRDEPRNTRIPNDRRRDYRTERPRKRVEKMTHATPRGAKSGQEFSLKVSISEEIYRNVGSVFVYFNTARSDVRQKLKMLPGRGNEYETRIPRHYMVGSQIRYYFQAEDRGDRPLAALGSASQPFLLELQGDTLGATRFASGSSLDGSDDGDGGGDSSGRKYFGLTLNAGTGIGWVKLIAKPVTQLGAELKEAGFALAPFHTLVGADFWVSKNFSVGGFARIQIIEFSFLGGGRLQYVTNRSGPHEVRVRFGSGMGYVRHLVELGDRFDTTLEGVGHVSLGMTYRYKLGNTAGFVLSPDYLHMFGASPSYHFDFNLGIELLF